MHKPETNSRYETRSVRVSTNAKAPEDRRVLRTRRTLHAALMGLLQEKSWDAITVQTLCDRADVGRSTFYLHYSDKDALLEGGFQDFRKMLRSHLGLGAKQPTPPLEFAQALLGHAHQQPKLFRAMLGRRSGQPLMRRFRQLIIELVNEDLTASGAAGASRETAVHFIAGAFLELLAWSLEGRGAPPSTELAALFIRLAEPAIAATRSA